MSYHIAYILESFSAHYGGPTVAAQCTGAEMEKLGHQVSYWAPGAPAEQAEMRAIPQAHITELNRPYSLRYSRDFSRELERSIADIDLLHIGYLWTYPVYAASRVAMRAHKPFIITPHGSLMPWTLRSALVKRLKKFVFLRTIARQLFRNCVCLHAVNEKEARSFRAAGFTGEIIVVPNGVDAEIYRPADPPNPLEPVRPAWPEFGERRVTLFLSRINPVKGLDLLLEAWAQLTREKMLRDDLLVIAGPGDAAYRAQLEKYVADAKLESSVLFFDMVSGARKIALLQRADVVVLPSYSENFGIVVAEALACGVPVITTTGTPWEQIREHDCGWYVEPGAWALKQALNEYKKMNKSELTRMGANGRKLVQGRYSWDAVAQDLEKIYTSIIQGERIPQNFLAQI